MRKITRKGLIRKLDAIVKEIVFARDRECVTCPLWMEIKKDNPTPHTPSNIMQPGHFITRGAKSIRWDLRNVYKQCRTCNFLHEHHPEVLANYVVNTLGVKEFEKLVFDGNQFKRWLMPELEELYEKLKEIKNPKVMTYPNENIHDLSVANENTK